MTDLLPMTTLTQQLMQRTLQKTAIALPFAQDIFLLETHVAGLHYYDIKNLHEALKITDVLQLCREPSNSHDELAIEIFTLSRQKLGYVPKFRNPVLARLMDAGKLLVAEVASIQFGNDRMSGYRQEDDSNTAIVDVRLKIALRE
ncbi:MAG: HIRAN domain-containing protein [Methylococcales bacterium]|nr:HIRAN domain-containing protein [Methylococcales bacterium]